MAYDLEVKGHGQLYLKSVFHFSTECVHIWENGCLWFVDDNHGFGLLI